MNSFQSRAQRMAEGGRDSRVPWRSAVGRSRPTAALRARRCAYSRSSNHARHALRLRTDSCASCASAVFAIATALIAPRSSHRTRPVPLSSLRAHPSALIALFATEDRCTHIDRVRTAISVLLCVRIRMSRSLPQSILFCEFKLSIFVSLPPDSLERGGLRSPIGHCDSRVFSRILAYPPRILHIRVFSRILAYLPRILAYPAYSPRILAYPPRIRVRVWLYQSCTAQ